MSKLATERMSVPPPPALPVHTLNRYCAAPETVPISNDALSDPPVAVTDGPAEKQSVVKESSVDVATATLFRFAVHW